MLKNSIIDWEKNIKKIEKNKNNEKYFVDVAKKNLNEFFEDLESPNNKSMLKRVLKYSTQIKKATYEDFVKYLKEYKFSENLIVLEAGR